MIQVVATAQTSGLAQGKGQRMGMSRWWKDELLSRGDVGLETKILKPGLYFGRVHLLLVQLMPAFHYYFVAPLVLGRISRVIPSLSSALQCLGTCHSFFRRC